MSGTVDWRLATGGPVRASAVIDGATAYVGSLDGNVYAIDTTDGALRWKHDLAFEIVSSATVADGLVIVGADGLYALDEATGAQRWHLDTADVVVSSPAVAGGTVIVGSNDGNVYGAAVADGSASWHVATGGSVQSSPVVAGRHRLRRECRRLLVRDRRRRTTASVGSDRSAPR